MSNILGFTLYPAKLTWIGMTKTKEMVDAGVSMADKAIKKTGNALTKAAHAGVSLATKSIKALNLKPATAVLKTSSASLKHKSHGFQSSIQRVLGILGLVDTTKKLINAEYTLEKTLDASARLVTGTNTLEDKDAVAWLLLTGKALYQELGKIIPRMSSKEFEPLKKELEKTFDFSKTSKIFEALGVQGILDKLDQVRNVLEDPKSTDQEKAQAYVKLIGALTGLAVLANSLNIVKLSESVLSGLLYIGSLVALKGEIDTLHQNPLELLRDKTYSSIVKDENSLERAFTHHALVFRVKEKTHVWETFENAAQPLLENVKKASSPEELRVAVDAYAAERSKFTQLFGQILPDMGKLKEQLEKGLTTLRAQT